MFSERQSLSNSVRLAGLDFESSDLHSATKHILQLVAENAPVSIRLTNAYSVALASRDTDYSKVLASPGVNYPDGTPLVWAMRLFGGRKMNVETVRGPSLFRSVVSAGRSQGVRHFLLGTTEETLLQLRSRLEFEYPGAIVAGMHAPDFGPLDGDFFSAAVGAIQDSDTDLVWVGMGTPKQDFASVVLAEQSGRVTIAVGAAFDFVAGTSDEAPGLFQNSGFEWVYRFYKEPRRLWRRYIFGNLRFLQVVGTGFVRSVFRRSERTV